MAGNFRTLMRNVLCLCVTVFFAVAFAAPKLQVDTADYDAGTIREGSIDKLRHTFVIRNTGDEPLRIEQVKPG
jgi:hypothetical protein